MYLVKIGHFVEITQIAVGKMQTNPDFSEDSFVVFYQPFCSAKTGIGLKYKFGSCFFFRKRGNVHPSKIHLRRLLTNGTKSSVCGDRAA